MVCSFIAGKGASAALLAGRSIISIDNVTLTKSALRSAMLYHQEFLEQKGVMLKSVMKMNKVKRMRYIYILQELCNVTIVSPFSKYI